MQCEIPQTLQKAKSDLLLLEVPLFKLIITLLFFYFPVEYLGVGPRGSMLALIKGVFFGLMGRRNS